MHEQIEGSSLHRRILALEEVYGKIEVSQAEFREAAEAGAAPLACPPGCSTCCRGFVPDVLPIEAERAALFLLTERQDLLGRFLDLENGPGDPAATCAFWEPLNPVGGCSIYPARALICRFFGFSAMKNKEGEPAFTICRWMPSPRGVENRILIGRASLERIFGAVPPAMTDLSFAAAAIDPDDAGLRLPLHEALGPAIARVSLTLRMKAAESGLQKPGGGYSV